MANGEPLGYYNQFVEFGPTQKRIPYPPLPIPLWLILDDGDDQCEHAPVRINPNGSRYIKPIDIVRSKAARAEIEKQCSKRLKDSGVPIVVDQIQGIESGKRRASETPE